MDACSHLKGHTHQTSNVLLHLNDHLQKRSDGEVLPQEAAVLPQCRPLLGSVLPRQSVQLREALLRETGKRLVKVLNEIVKHFTKMLLDWLDLVVLYLHQLLDRVHSFFEALDCEVDQVERVDAIGAVLPLTVNLSGEGERGRVMEANYISYNVSS